MTPRTFCESGRCEPIKGAVHGVMLIGAILCCGYNVSAFYYRRERHNGVNALVYGALAWLEIQHVRHHARPA